MSEPTPDHNPLLDKLDNLEQMLEAEPLAEALAPFPPFEEAEEEEEEILAEPEPPPAFVPEEILGELESLADVLSPATPIPHSPRPKPGPDPSLDLFAEPEPTEAP